ncbi:MAG: hypothetical protein MJ064_08455 [Lachnospiraceae bacterium]|nr:hypothetical protein [Lachnospiraceae bacterium]
MSTRRVYDCLPEIQIGETGQPEQPVNVFLVGNGINLPFDGAVKTDDIIRKIWRKYHHSNLPRRLDSIHSHPLWRLPFPMEIVSASNNNLDIELQEFAQKLRDGSVDNEQRMLIQAALDLNFDAILSTNYSLEFEKSVMGNCAVQRIYSQYRTTAKQSEQQKRLGIYQYTELPYGNKPSLWHIHGTALRKNSLVMGHLSYGKLVGEIDQRASRANRGIHYAKANRTPFYPMSWIDYFLIGNVYIVGFALDFAESDIWWLISLKKRINPDSKVFFFQPYIEEAMKLMLDSYGVECPFVEFDESNNPSLDYMKYYRAVFEYCKRRMTDGNF